MVVESDSQTLINKLNGLIEVSQEVRVVLNDVRALGRGFASVFFLSLGALLIM